MTNYCIWEDCDQEALYCEGHARELENPLDTNIRALLSVYDAAKNMSDNIENPMNGIHIARPKDHAELLAALSRIKPCSQSITITTY